MPPTGQEGMRDPLTSLLGRGFVGDRGRAREEYDKAYNHLLNYRRNMDYARYRAEHLPIGSGVTEAACKTVFTQRFKCSGMIWNRDQDYDHRDPEATITGARSVLILR